ncbi:hypothetical protein E8E14_008933 [Neopestalotiopsis sp. 37M]|nr:hypothetical protein E8E14_008933 [Neopestalotiopsis sp. 37M]
MATDHVHPGTDEIQPATEHHSAKGKGHALPAKVHKNPATDHVHLVTDEIPAATEHHVAKGKIHAHPAKGKGHARPAKAHRNPATDEIQPATDHVHGGASDGPHPGRLWKPGSKSPWTPKKDKKDQGYPAWRHEDAPPPRDPVSLTVIRGIEKCHEKIYNFLDFRHMLRGPDITTFDMFSHISKLRISYPTHGFIERRTIPYYCVKNEIPTFHMYQLDRRQTYLVVVVDKAAQNYVGPCLAWLQLGYHWRQESNSWEELETKDPTPVTFPKGKINPPTGWLSFKKNHMSPVPRPESNSPTSHRDQDVAAVSGADSASPSSAAVTPSAQSVQNSNTEDGVAVPDNSSSGSNPENAMNSLVNVTHLELFYHFSQSAGPLFVGDDIDLLNKYMNNYFSAGLTETYLVHQMLAFSAKHKSRTGPESQAKFYEDQATLLQTQALILFTASRQKPRSYTSAVASMRFSSLLGTHLLCDTLAKRHVNLDSFMVQFDEYMKVHRGVRPIFDQYRDYLLTSELRPILVWGWKIVQTKGEGPECDPLREMLSDKHLDSAAVAAYTHAIDMLQRVIDDYKSRPTFPGPAPWTTVWLNGIKPEYTNLLLAREPGALAIFAYYGAMIHTHHRDLWLVGESGKHIIELATQALGPEWTPRLRWPLEICKNQLFTCYMSWTILRRSCVAMLTSL